MEKEIYPIGTVVELVQNSKVPMMIIGYKPMKEDGTKKDYVAVAYPIGCIDSKYFFMINQEEIKEVIFPGYASTSFVAFREHFLRESAETQEES